ncbi:MAG: LON peptidase substrate-binding domain-containing protein [Pseudobdellovibrionaceae bacterium]
MCPSILDPDFNALPQEIPVFPLEGVVLLPRGDLPLNIFELRYMDMVQGALASPTRLIGMIQPSENGLYQIGCAGRIIRFEETHDGRYLITLRGLCRFRTVEETTPSLGAYRRMKVDWRGFEHDMIKIGCLDIDRTRLLGMLKDYFTLQGLTLDWDMIAEIADEGLMTSLAMVCPFEAAEKQALIEAPCCKSRANLFMNLLEMAICQHDPCCDKKH